MRLAFQTALVAILLSTLVAAQAAISPDARQYLEAALGLVQKNSVRRHVVDWPNIRAETFARAQSAQTPAETHDAIRWLLTALGDRHSGFFDPKTVASLNTLAAAVSPPPEGRLVSDRLGYLLVPQFGSADQQVINGHATRIQDLRQGSRRAEPVRLDYRSSPERRRQHVADAGWTRPAGRRGYLSSVTHHRRRFPSPHERGFSTSRIADGSVPRTFGGHG